LNAVICINNVAKWRNQTIISNSYAVARKNIGMIPNTAIIADVDPRRRLRCADPYPLLEDDVVMNSNIVFVPQDGYVFIDMNTMPLVFDVSEDKVPPKEMK
jgi:hypothetical protein